MKSGLVEWFGLGWRESKEKKLAWECEQGQGDFDWSTLILIRNLKQIPEIAWRFIPYRQAAHQISVLFLIWHEPLGGDEFLLGGATLLRSILVSCNAVCVLINWIIEIGVESVTCVEEAWFVQALLLRLAASKAPPGDDTGRGLFCEVLVAELRVEIWSRRVYSGPWNGATYQIRLTELLKGNQRGFAADTAPGGTGRCAGRCD
ncbi:hypothetical protein DEO72_LG9g877 [Vigna unguiculata]|uniref:Uncharacterized protein n=1 Tax=Vigna unguiculata TaxID=3917 RepID=A0A4D6N094_VIGUN|nr:hypothetical protein DEO72_LG9g877 [Vigna unguiculata]